MSTRQAEILAVGTELLLGDIVNTNAQFLSQELAAMGIGVLHQTVVGDNEGRLAEALQLALSRSDIIITTGGLGPTGDDITREVAARVLGLSLRLDEQSFSRMREYFTRAGRAMTDNNRKQAMLPEGCTVFENEWGTAPGCAVENGGKTVVMLPGPPREMRPMFLEKARPFLMKFSDGTIFSTSLRVFGIGEGSVEAQLSDLMQGANPTLAPYAKDGEVLLRVTARASTEAEARDLCTPLRDRVKARLGVYVYGENVDSLQQVVVQKLHEKHLKIGLAESCTGGLVAKRLTEIPGASDVFECGVVSYANRIKSRLLGVRSETLETHGAVSLETAAEMAEGARLQAGAAIGVGITGIAGPGGGTPEKPVGLVYVGLSDGKTCLVRRLTLGRTGRERDYIRYLAASNALDMVRRYLDGFGQPDDCTQVPVPLLRLPAGAAAVKAPFSLKSLTPQAVGAWFRRTFTRQNLRAAGKRWVRNNIPMKGDSPKQIVFKSLFLACMAVFIGCLCYLIPYVTDYFHNLNVTSYAQSLYTPEEKNKRASNGILSEFAKLYNLNHDVRGWITIPDTHIDYPVVQSTDNDYYLRRDVTKAYNRHGVPFLDYRCTTQPFSWNTIIYGHNMKDDLMFHDLTKYEDSDFYNESPIVTFNTLQGNYKWKIFAAYITNATPAGGKVFNYLVPTFSSTQDFENYIAQVRARSLITTSVDVQPTDQILTLSTCTYEFTDARMVIVARMVRNGESLAVGKGTKNWNALMPDIWYKKYGGTPPAVSLPGDYTAGQSLFTSSVASAASGKPASSSAGSKTSSSKSSSAVSTASTASRKTSGISSSSSSEKSSSSGGSKSSSSTSGSSGGSSSGGSSSKQESSSGSSSSGNSSSENGSSSGGSSSSEASSKPA